MRLSKTRERDIEMIVSIENEADNAAFIFPNTLQEHLDLVHHPDIAHLILQDDHKKPLGFVILAGLENTNKSIEFRRIVILEKGRGYGRMAISIIKRYCFEELKCHRLWLDVLEHNERARHLYQSEGFQQEGILRDYILDNGEFKNLVLMSMLESEYHRALDQS